MHPPSEQQMSRWNSVEISNGRKVKPATKKKVVRQHESNKSDSLNNLGPTLHAVKAGFVWHQRHPEIIVSLFLIDCYYLLLKYSKATSLYALLAWSLPLEVKECYSMRYATIKNALFCFFDNFLLISYIVQLGWPTFPYPTRITFSSQGRNGSEISSRSPACGRPAAVKAVP